jgi:hypothetical protein
LISLQASYCNKNHGNQNESFKRLQQAWQWRASNCAFMNKGPRGRSCTRSWRMNGTPTAYPKIYDPNYCNEERSWTWKAGIYLTRYHVWRNLFPRSSPQSQCSGKEDGSLYAFHVEAS